MEKRTVLSVICCLGIIMVWYGFIAPWLYPPPKRQPAPPPPPQAPVKPVEVVKPPEPPPSRFAAEPSWVLRTSRLHLTFTNRGGGVESALLYYPDDKKPPVPMLQPKEPGRPHFALRHVGGPEPIESLPWKIHERTDRVVEFRYPLENGVEIRKRFEIEPDKHVFQVKLFMEKTQPGKPDPDIQLEFFPFNGLEDDSAYRYELYSRGFHFDDGNLKYRELARMQNGERALEAAQAVPDAEARAKAVKKAEGDLVVREGRRGWLGVNNRFFTAILMPASEHEIRVLESYWFRGLSKAAVERSEKRNGFNVSVLTHPIKVGKQAVYMAFRSYLGPLHRTALAEAGRDGEQLVDYGTTGCFISVMFNPVVNLVSPFILAILKFFGGLFGNWGWGIVFTTFLIRICLFPLTKKSQVSMFRMQQLGPKIALLKERYGDDRQKMGLEHMRLMKEHKINPMAGCLPLFFQMPIFLGMYSVFERTIELRGEAFMLWMVDLSQPDRLLGPWTPVPIPLIFTTISIDALNLLPILMTITWVLQAYFAPRSPDPQMQMQQKMIMWMPVVFMFAVYSLASGLSLYFFVNSLFGMTETKLIKKYFLPRVDAPPR